MDPKFVFFGPTLTLRFPLTMAKIEESKTVKEKIQPSGYPKMPKSSPVSCPFQMKNRMSFCTFWAFLYKKRHYQRLKGQNN